MSARLVLRNVIQERKLVPFSKLYDYIKVAGENNSDITLLSEPFMFNNTTKKFLSLAKPRQASILRFDNLYRKVSTKDPVHDLTLNIAFELFYRAKRQVSKNNTGAITIESSILFLIESRIIEGIPQMFLNPVVTVTEATTCPTQPC